MYETECCCPLLQEVLQAFEAVLLTVLGSDADNKEHNQETSLEEGKNGWMSITPCPGFKAAVIVT